MDEAANAMWRDLPGNQAGTNTQYKSHRVGLMADNVLMFIIFFIAFLKIEVV